MPPMPLRGLVFVQGTTKQGANDSVGASVRAIAGPKRYSSKQHTQQRRPRRISGNNTVGSGHDGEPREQRWLSVTVCWSFSTRWSRLVSRTTRKDLTTLSQRINKRYNSVSFDNWKDGSDLRRRFFIF